MNIGIVNKKTETAKRLSLSLSQWLRKRGHSVFNISDVEHLPDIEFVIVFGGDGTLLHTARLLKGKEIPILGINMGGLGFLTETSVDDAKSAIEKAIKGECSVSKRMMCDVKLVRKGSIILEEKVLNDAVITKGKIARMIEMEAFVGNTKLSSYRADGLIVSTPTGSTAYVLSAGGPIVSPDLDCMVLCPICPHTLTNRPLVISAEADVSVAILSEKDIYLTLDGQQAYSLKKNDRVIISRSSAKTSLITFKNFFDVLKNKLHWGER